MKKCVIFCAGEFTELAELIGEEDIVIVADGGLQHTENLGIRPDVILGDFDSLGYIPAGAEVSPVEKNDTDAMLAIKKGLELGCDAFVIYGGLDGKRLDHTIANYQALMYLAQRGVRGWLVGRRQIVTAIEDDKVVFPPYCIGYLSVFCLGKDAQGVKISNLKYEMEDGTLTAGFPLGVSNQFIQKKATVEVKNGTLLLMWQRKNGIQ